MAALAVGAAAPPAAAQTLTLADAWRRADGGAYGNRLAVAAARADEARAGTTLRGILPTLRFEAGWQRTTDPIGAFGTVLRQRQVTPAAFDPAALNNPAPAGDVAAGAILEVPVLMPEAWAGRSAATRSGEAARAGARWTRERTRADVVRAYFGAVLAAERVATLDAALLAAGNHVRAAEALVAGGLALRSDALLASVKAGEIEADLAAARADATLARAALALLLGAPADTAFVLPTELPGADRLRGWVDTGSVTAARGDVEAARIAVTAAGADLRRARAALLPRISAFARYDWHTARAPFAARPMWTIGVLAGWSPFSGGFELADGRAAAARLEAARAGADATEAGGRIDIARRDADFGVALQRLDIAVRAVSQSAEAHRLVSRKYESGLATVVELLDAAAVETASRLRHAAARHDVIVAAAARLQARGLPLDPLRTLQPDTTP